MTASPDPGVAATASNNLLRAIYDNIAARRSWILGFLGLASVAVLWSLAAERAWVNPMFLPSMAEVGTAIVQVVTSDRFVNDLRVSGYEFAWGLGLSVLLGGALGILSGWFKPVEEFLQPLVIALNSIPNLALIPLLILIFGIGTLPKILLVMLSCVIVMIMNTAAGVKAADAQLMRMATSYKATQAQLIRTVVVPSVTPYFMTGVRICVGKAVVTVAVAEIFGSTAGIGNLLIVAQTSFNMPVMYATVIILTVIGIALTQAAELIERYFLRWRG